jgi:2-oxoglutarate dehydrogenase complex dehydrogenase (E1) component-like enzyme
MMPKSLLRHEKSSSPIIDFTEKSFESVIDDSEVKEASQVKKIIFCSGKIFITLSTEREAQKISNVAIVRVEELYPFPEVEIKNILKKYSKATQFIWAQEEPQNMGAWSFISPKILKVLGEGRSLMFVGREEAASPAVGSHKMHELEEKEILKNAFQ